ncbi:hypothetical protein VPH159E362A_0051 [Vibrio phage 159E36-2a]
MDREYRVKYFKIGVMGNKYSIGQYEFSVDRHELKVCKGSIANVGVMKTKELHRHFPPGNTAYKYTIVEINKSKLLVMIDGIRGLLKLTADQLRGRV